jgi:hypothetical protein
VPAVSTRDREAGDDLRELYRKTIAAGFSSQPGEPSADHVVEEIFAGGDGFGRQRNPATGSIGRRGSAEHPRAAGDAGYWSDGGEARASSAAAGGGVAVAAAAASATAKSPWPEFGGGYGKPGGGVAQAVGRERARSGAEEVFRSGAAGGVGRPARGSFGAAAAHAAEVERGWAPASVPEVDELDVRDDLRCWNSRI